MGADPLGLREILPSSGASETKEEAHGPNPPLLRLPPEIQAVIVECIFMPSDLKNLCLVCKELRDVATRALHVDVTIDLDEAQHQGRGFFQHGHYGHRFVRRLSFSSSLDQRPYPDALYENNDRQHIEDALRSEARKIYKQARWRAFTTLQLLPQDTLTHFSHVLPLSSSLMTALYTQQRKLKSLALGPVFSACTGELAQPKQWLAELECLEIPEAIGNDEDLAFYGRVIIDCPKLMELTLRTDRATGRQDLEEGFQDRTASDGLLYKMLFQNTVSQSKKLELRSLTLKMVDLSHSGRTFVNAFRFEKLEHLSLISCDGSDVLLRAITAKYKSTIPALQSFGYHYDRNHRCSQRLLALQDFFESFSGLKYLTVQDERGKTYLDLECLASHAPTLRQLCVGMGSNFDDLDHLIPPVSNARTLLGRCKRLRRLAIAHPLVVPRSLGIDWPSGCKGFVDAIAQVRSLQVLRILNFPFEGCLDTDSLEGHFESVEDFANAIFFRALPAAGTDGMPHLVMFGMGDGLAFDNGNDDNCWMRSAWFIPEKRIDVYGRKHTVAIPISIARAKGVDPAATAFHADVRGRQGLGLGS